MIHDLLQEAYGAMRHNRRRTSLTMLGMGWGIATVVMLLAYGDGFGRACENIFANFGTKLVIVVPGKTSTQAGGQKSGQQIRFTQDDVEALTTNLPQITHVTPSVDKQVNVGEYIRLDGLSFEVVGVLSAKMQEGNDDINRVVYVPFTTMSDLKDTHYLDTIWFNYQTPEFE